MDQNVPKHIAIIMDGNRRWAKARGLSSYEGHKEGGEALRRVVEAAAKAGVEVVTVYALSTENLKERPKEELGGIFRIIEETFRVRIPELIENGVKVEVIGELEGLPKVVQGIINKTNNVEIKDQKIKLNIAFNYGGKKEILLAVRELIREGVSADEIDEEEFRKRLNAPSSPDPELVIRTGGKKRLSNFLIWQTAYSELYFTDTLWPDFDAEQLSKAIAWFGEQQRNFGK